MLGDLRVARAEFGKDLKCVPRAMDWAQAGGGLLDLGIHDIPKAYGSYEELAKDPNVGE